MSNYIESTKENTSYQIPLIGFLVFLTILAPALLHTNQPEFLVERLGISILDASYFDTALYVSYLLIGILTAIISNQIGRRKVFISIGTMGSSIFYLLMTLTNIFPLILVFRFIQGGFTVLCWQTLMTMILDLSSKKNRGRNMGIFGIFLASAMGGGPVLGGIFAGWGILAPYYSASILSFMAFVIALVLLKEPEKLSSKPSLGENMNIVFRNPRVIIPGIFNFVDRLHIGFILFILPLFLQMELDVQPELRGMVLGIFALPFIILQYPVGRLSDRIGRYKPLIPGSIGTGIMIIITGYLSSYGLFLVFITFFLIGVCNGFTGPPAMALVGDIVKKEDNPVGMGFFNLLGNIGIIIGPLIGGILVTYTNFVIAFIVAGLIEFLSLIGVILIILFIFNENPFNISPHNAETSRK
ncbi:MAG: MFS transporter [Candidatus Hodarchaeales archaeon]|jgi:MFS family permease